MKLSDLSVDRVRCALDYQEATGLFIWKVKKARSVPGSVAGAMGKNYWYIGFDGLNISAHRLAWFYVYGEWPNGEIDHIDRNKTNNRIENLRVVGRAENNHNIEANGFTKDRSGYSAQIVSNGKRYFLGSYKTQSSARDAYLSAKRILHPTSPLNVGEVTESDLKVLPQNNGLSRRNTSGHTGVSFRAKRNEYESHIRLNGQYKYVGRFKTLEAAIAARASALGQADPKCHGCKHKIQQGATA